MVAAAEKPAAYRWWVLTLASLINGLVGGASWTIMPVLFYEISQAQPVGLGLSLIQLGTIWGVFSLAVGVFSIPMGMAADRFGVRWIVGCGLLVTALGGALRATSSGFMILLIWMFIFGIGFSTIMPNLFKLIGMWFPPRELGMSNGISISVYGLGAGLAIQFGGSVLSPVAGGWRNLFFIFGGITAVIAAIWILTARERNLATVHTAETKKESFFYSINIALHTRDVWFLAIVQFMLMAGYLGLIGYLPMYLLGKGLSMAEANGLISLVPYSMIVGSLVIPILSDKMGSRKWFYIIFVGAITLAILCAAFVTGIFLTLALIVWGFSSGASALTIVVPLEHPSLGPRLAGSAIGLLTAMGFVGGFISPLVGNGIAEGAGGVAAILFWAACYALSVLAFILVSETHPRRAKVKKAAAAESVRV